MAKLLPNRLSETMSLDQQKQFREALKTAIKTLPERPVLSKEEFDKIPKKGEVRIKEAELRIKVVRKFPKFLPAALNVQEVENDNLLFDQLNQLYTDELMPLVEAVQLLLGLSGGEEMNAYSRFYDNVKKAKDDGDKEGILAFDELDTIDKQLGIGSYRKSPADKKPKTPTTPPKP